MLKRLRGDERGAVLVTAVLASAIVLLLSISAVSVAIHNTNESGYDRGRLQAIGAAEAGVDAYYSMLNTTQFTSANLISVTGSSSCVLTKTLSTTPSVTVTVTPTYYTDSSGGNPASCPTPTFLGINATGPWYVRLSAVGTVGGSPGATRTMQSRARLSVTGSGLVFPAAAMLGNVSVGLAANVQVYGNNGNDANLYSNGNMSVTTQSNIKGNMYVQGNLTIANGNFQLAGDAWASSWVKVSGGFIGGAVIASGSTTTTCPSGSSPASASICVSGNTTTGGLSSGGARAGGAIAVKSPAVVNGTQSPNTSGIANPPSQTYPTYTFTAGDWPGYISASSCASAISSINSWSSGNLYIRLTGCSDLNPPSKALPGNLAILTDGGITFLSNTKFTNASAGTPVVYMFTGLTGTCGNVTAQANTGFGAGVKSIIFTPQACSVTVNSNAFNGTGQIFSGSIAFNANTTMTYAPITLPQEAMGLAGVYVDIVYKREVTS